MSLTPGTPGARTARWVAAGALLCALLAGALPARAAGTLYVSTAGDDGNDCLSPAAACRTIVAALGKSAAGDTIAIGPGTYSERPTIFSDVTLAGAGAQQTVIDGAGAGGVFTIFTAHVRMQGLTIRNGRSVGAGGGITNFGWLTLVESSVSENVTTLGEGFQGFGGGIANFGTLAMTSTAVLSNTGVFGGGIYSRGPLSAINTTISGNTALNDGGGIANVLLGSAQLAFSTVAANTADGNGDGAGAGGGLYNASTSTVTLGSSLIGGNSDTSGQAPDCSGVYQSAGRNLVQSSLGCTLDGPGSHDELVGQDARLGALGDNGGPTLTHALLADSPARDHGDGPSCPATDQRGAARPQGPACDTGAYEAEPAPPAGDVRYVAPQGDDASNCLSAQAPCRTIGAAQAKIAAGGTIRVAAGLYRERLAFGADLSVEGAGSDQTIVDGDGLAGVVTVAAGHVRLAGLTIRNGRGVGAGGGIANFGTLTLEASAIRDNAAVLGEGFQGLGGGIANFGTLTLSDTTVLSNTAFVGGGIYNGGTLTALDSTLASNHAILGGGVQTGIGGGLANMRRAELTRTSIVGNTAESERAGTGALADVLHGLGGGAANFGTMVLSATSVLSNSASFGAGLVNFGDLSGTNTTLSANLARSSGGGLANAWQARADLLHATIADNLADQDGDGLGGGGGISNDMGGAVRLHSSILAGNATSTGDAPDCLGALSSQGHNLFALLDGCALPDRQASDIVAPSAQLDQLADNGGPTLTQALLEGSPAIDAADGAACPATDQRGAARPSGAGCDIGSYEFGAAVPEGARHFAFIPSLMR